MTIINSDTNVSFGGIKLPLGAFTWPEEGTVSIVTSSGYSNTVSVGAMDAVMIDRSSITVSVGPEPMLWLACGFGLTLGMGVVIGFARYAMRSLGGAGRIEW